MSEPNSQTLNPGTHLLHRFRSDRKRLPLHPLEKAVLTVVALHLCFLPWALGTMLAWSQLTSLGFGVLGLGLALIPRHYSTDLSGGPDMRLGMWPRLLHFPLFWIGLALLAYIAVQGFNPSWIWERNATTWWLRRITEISWLPTSIDTPFGRFNLWRQFIIYASAWLTVCTVWVGFTRRRSLALLLLVVLFNALALACFGGLQRVTAEFYLHDLFKVRPSTGSFASFVYHNHAGAYFALVTAMAVAYASRHAFGGAGPLRKSTPAPLFLVGAALLAATTIFTRSRGATLTLAGFALAVTLLVGLPGLLHRAADAGRRWITVSITLLFALTLGLTIQWLDFDSVIRKFERAVEQREMEVNIRSRLIAHKAAYEFLKDHGARGIGAGGFRHYFPEYTKRYPEIYRDHNRVQFWEHAHNDWLQIPIELGAVGVSLLLLGGGWLSLGLVRRRVWRHPFALPVLLGCGQTLIHAWFDFPFQNPAILLTWLALVTAATRWLELDGA